MSDGEALLAAVISSPDEDTPRLAYADYLDEHGQPDRAWLIRFQCDSQNQWSHDGAREYATVERHADAWFLLGRLSGRKRNRKYHDYYLRDFGPPNLALRWGRRGGRGLDRLAMDGYSVELPIRRGFYAGAECPPAFWVRHGDALRAGHPVTTVALTSVPLLVGEEGDVGLSGDPAGRRFAWADVRAEADRLGIDMTGYPSVIPRAVCGLRWPGVTFQLEL